MMRSTWLAMVALSLVTFSVSADEGFEPLVKSADLSDFGFVLRDADADPAKTFSVEDGVIKVTGQPFGYFHTKKSYKNYVLKLDFRFPEKAGNSGYLIHITDDHKVWPKCIEVQGQYSQAGLIFAIGGAQGPDNRKEPEKVKAVADAAKPHQEWNSIVITSQDGKLTSTLNGKPVGEGKYGLTEGQIGFQSEGAPIEFRNLMIKVID